MKHATNFSIHSSKHSAKKKRNVIFQFMLRIKWILVAVFIALIFCGVLVLVNYSTAKNTYAFANSGKSYFELAQQSLEKQDFSEAASNLQNARLQFEESQRSLHLLKGVKYIPFCVQQISAIDHLLMAGIQTSRAVEKVTIIGDLIMKETAHSSQTNLNMITVEQRKKILKILYESLPDFQAAKADIGLAETSLSQISKFGVLKRIRHSVAPMQEKLPLIRDVINQLVPLSEIVPQIVGYPDQKTYLFLLQNNTELRPTGGFIGTYGILKLQNGDISHFSTDDTYNLDEKVKDQRTTVPPWPFKKYIGITKWFFRDSNWAPDFPETARTAVRFYHEENGPEKKIDGVIAITPTLIESLLRLVGDIKVDGVLFTPENFTSVLEEEVELKYRNKGLDVSERKEIVGDLADELMKRLLSLPKSKWKELWSTIQNDINEKQILMYLFNDELQKLVAEEKWDGAIYQGNGDYVQVVDCNLASLKSDPGVKRTVYYNLEVSDKEAIAQLTMHYKNEGDFSWKSTRYRTYVRAYVPEGSTLISYEGAMDTDKLSGGKLGNVEILNEFGKTRFGAFISIEPDAEGDLKFQYKLPDRVFQEIRNEQYELVIQKQPGTIAHGLEVSLLFPRSIQTYSLPELKQEVSGGKILYKTDLRIDREFQVQL